MPKIHQDTTDVFHATKALLAECKRDSPSAAVRRKIAAVTDNLAYMYGQLALLEDQEPNGIDLNDGSQDEGDEELW